MVFRRAVRRDGWCSNEIHDDGSREVVRSQSEPGEEEVHKVVKELDVEEEHSNEVVSGFVHATKVHEGIERGGKGTVQPTTTLADELGRTFGNVSLALGGLDVSQVPLLASLGNKFKAENTVLCQEHVLLEDIHSIDTLLAEASRKSVISMEILL